MYVNSETGIIQPIEELGAALAAQLCGKEPAQHMSACQAIKQSFLMAVEALRYTLNGDQNYCLPSAVNISFHGVDAEKSAPKKM